MSTGKSKAGWDELVSNVQHSLNHEMLSNLPAGTKKQAEFIIDTVISAIEETLINNLPNNKFSLKLKTFGKFIIRHRPSIYRRIPFTGEMKTTNAKRKVKFMALGKLRKQEIEEKNEL